MAEDTYLNITMTLRHSPTRDYHWVGESVRFSATVQDNGVGVPDVDVSFILYAPASEDGEPIVTVAKTDADGVATIARGVAVAGNHVMYCRSQVPTTSVAQLSFSVINTIESFGLSRGIPLRYGLGPMLVNDGFRFIV